MSGIHWLIRGFHKQVKIQLRSKTWQAGHWPGAKPLAHMARAWWLRCQQCGNVPLKESNHTKLCTYSFKNFEAIDLWRVRSVGFSKEIKTEEKWKTMQKKWKNMILWMAESCTLDGWNMLKPYKKNGVSTTNWCTMAISGPNLEQRAKGKRRRRSGPANAQRGEAVHEKLAWPEWVRWHVANAYRIMYRL